MVQIRVDLLDEVQGHYKVRLIRTFLDYPASENFHRFALRFHEHKPCDAVILVNYNARGSDLNLLLACQLTGW